jgi:hypothetical protein
LSFFSEAPIQDEHMEEPSAIEVLMASLQALPAEEDCDRSPADMEA